MKSTLLASAVALSAALTSLASVPQVSDVSFTQDPDTRRVTIGYRLSAPAIVTVDVQTNRGDGTFATIGTAGLRFVSGAVNKFVTNVNATVTIGWSPDLNWCHNGKIAAEDVKAVVTAWATNAPPDYMVFNLLDLDDVRYYVDEASFPVPIGDDKYKFDHLVMRKIHAAGVPWRMGAPSGWYSITQTDGVVHPHRVTLTEDYYMGIYELTRYQSYLLTGVTGSSSGNRTPCNAQSYNAIRGGYSDEIDWPDTGHKVKTDSRIDKIRKALGIEVDLPTRAQWEFAARAGCPWPLYTGEDAGYAVTNLAWTKDNGGSAEQEVGQFPPNPWGLYDMIGGVQEWTLDYAQDWTTEAGQAALAESIDPKGPKTASDSNFNRCMLGGSWNTAYTSCHVYGITYEPASDNWGNLGYRLCAPASAPLRTK